VTGPVGEYKLKEKFNIRKIDIADREDSEGMCMYIINIHFNLLHFITRPHEVVGF
jgi:hypothetical protein